MVVRLCLLGWLVCWPLRLVGAPGPGRNQAVAVLNQYVGYCNETIHALWMLHEAWRGLNTSANSYLTYGRGSLHFRQEDVLNQGELYETVPAELYQRCLTDSRVLGPGVQQALNGRLGAVRQVLEQLQALGAEASRYVEQKEQGSDPGLRRLFGLLERAEERFDAYDQAKEDLFAEVRRVYEAQYGPVNRQHRIVAAAQDFLPAVMVCKSLLDDLDRNDTSRVGGYVQELWYSPISGQLGSGVKQFGWALVGASRRWLG